MKFENINFIYILWFTPLLIFFFIYTFKRRKVLLERFCSHNLCLKIIEGYSQGRRIFKYFLLLLVFMLIVITLAGPQWGYRWEDIHRRGVDIYIALDISDSMLANDMKPNRLERAKREIKDFIRALTGDRVGMVVFAGSSYIQCPLTTDYGTLEMFIDEIKPQDFPVKGTSIGSALKTCLDAFNRSAESSSKAIILITDGEDHMGDVSKMAQEAKSQGVQIYSIGLGESSGSSIPYNAGFKKDLYGNTIISTPNFNQLKDIAKITGGIYVHSVTGNLDIDKIYIQGIKRTLKARDLKTTRAKIWIDRFQWPLAFAFFFLLIEFFISEKKRTKKKMKAKK